MSRGSYGGAHPAAGPGGVVAAVTAGGPAARAGISAGDTLLAVDGTRLRDVIDWQWQTASEGFDVSVLGTDGAERSVSVQRAWDEQPGVEFTATLFDGVRECDNACQFCFIAQLPPGLRRSLYVRDDDYRLSFLSGNFVTLTNLDDADVERIVEQRLSPLYASLHAVDDDVRRRLICATHEDLALQRADELLAAGIALHVQIVLVPGVNDGAVLERTLAWLASRPLIESVGVVPIGFTGHQRRYSVAFGEPEAASRVLDALEPWRTRMAVERGLRWVHAADELHLVADRGLPPTDDYDGFPQYENGIGLVRVFRDAWLADAAGSKPVVPTPSERVTLVTGELFAPTLLELVASAPPKGRDVRVLAVPNRFFGGNVSVTGLLTAVDIAAVVAADGAAGVYLVPDVVLSTDGVTLDDVPECALPALCGADVRVVSSDAAGFLAALSGLSVGHTG